MSSPRSITFSPRPTFQESDNPFWQSKNNRSVFSPEPDASQDRINHLRLLKTKFGSATNICELLERFDSNRLDVKAGDEAGCDITLLFFTTLHNHPWCTDLFPYSKGRLYANIQWTYLKKCAIQEQVVAELRNEQEAKSLLRQNCKIASNADKYALEIMELEGDLQQKQTQQDEEKSRILAACCVWVTEKEHVANSKIYNNITNPTVLLELVNQPEKFLKTIENNRFAAGFAVEVVRLFAHSSVNSDDSSLVDQLQNAGRYSSIYELMASITVSDAGFRALLEYAINNIEQPERDLLRRTTDKSPAIADAPTDIAYRALIRYLKYLKKIPAEVKEIALNGQSNKDTQAALDEYQKAKKGLLIGTNDRRNELRTVKQVIFNDATEIVQKENEPVEELAEELKFYNEGNNFFDAFMAYCEGLRQVDSYLTSLLTFLENMRLPKNLLHYAIFTGYGPNRSVIRSEAERIELRDSIKDEFRFTLDAMTVDHKNEVFLTLDDAITHHPPTIDDRSRKNSSSHSPRSSSQNSSPSTSPPTGSPPINYFTQLSGDNASGYGSELDSPKSSATNSRNNSPSSSPTSSQSIERYIQVKTPPDSSESEVESPTSSATSSQSNSPLSSPSASSSSIKRSLEQTEQMVL